MGDTKQGVFKAIPYLMESFWKNSEYYNDIRFAVARDAANSRSLWSVPKYETTARNLWFASISASFHQFWSDSPIELQSGESESRMPLDSMANSILTMPHSEIASQEHFCVHFILKRRF
jgi:hypothetical protein